MSGPCGQQTFLFLPPLRQQQDVPRLPRGLEGPLEGTLHPFMANANSQHIILQQQRNDPDHQTSTHQHGSWLYRRCTQLTLQSAKQTVFADMLGEKLWSYQTSAENSSNTSFLCGSGTVCCREQLCFATFTQRKRSCVRAAGLSTYTKPHFDRAVYVSRAAHC